MFSSLQITHLIPGIPKIVPFLATIPFTTGRYSILFINCLTIQPQAQVTDRIPMQPTLQSHNSRTNYFLGVIKTTYRIRSTRYVRGQYMDSINSTTFSATAFWSDSKPIRSVFAEVPNLLVVIYHPVCTQGKGDGGREEDWVTA